MTVKLSQSGPNEFRIEATNEDDSVEIATFFGPDAKVRAVFFATEYYGRITDTEGLLR